MTKQRQREIATSLTTASFLVVGITGVMMFFHVFDRYTTHLHEVLGMLFCVAAVFHTVCNFGSMKRYFTKKVFIGTLVLTATVTLLFVVNAGPDHGHAGVHIVLDRVFAAPLDDALPILTDDIDAARSRLQSAGIKTENTHTIGEMAKENDTSPFAILEIVRGTEGARREGH